MGSLWLKIKIWTKVIVASVLTVYVLIFLWKNGDQKVQFWYWFNRRPETSLLFLVFFAFLVGVLAAVLVGTALRTVRQIKELKSRNRASKLEAEIADMKVKAAMLQTRPTSSSPTTPISTSITTSLDDLAPPTPGPGPGNHV